MDFQNPSLWPEEILGILRQSVTAEYASLTKAGVPITFPLIPFLGQDGTTLDVTTGLTYTAKAQRARNNSKVCLLYSDPLGCGLDNPPIVLVYGLASVRDSDLQSNTDRYIHAFLNYNAEIRERMPDFFIRTMSWYLSRIYIEITPIRILWWEGGDLDQEPKAWSAPEGTTAPPSDPPPSGPGLKRWDDPPRTWRPEAEMALGTLGNPVLTAVDPDGFPVPMRTTGASLTPNGFELSLCSTAPAEARGRACLTFHRHDEALSWNSNLVFVGEAKPHADGAAFRVDRRITSISVKRSQVGSMLDMVRLWWKFAPRLKAEAQRRGQPVPKIILP
jgi:hypothetical protein